ncbi:MAG: GNAT family N-acetyltransferase [Chloroflexi bacterium]|nr:GNAT family N-acetyltransferase [Chloroflexota bacterium]
MPEITCQIVTKVSDWLDHREEIDELITTSSSANPHSTTSWLEAWWASFGAGHELRVGLFRQGRQLIGYAPLMLSRYRFLQIPYRSLHFVGEGLSDYADVQSRADDEDLKNEIVRIILSEWEWDDLLLMNVRDNSTTLGAFSKNVTPGSHLSIRPNTRCLYIDLHGRTFQEYYKTLSRNHRHELQKRKHKLDALGSWSLEFSPPMPSATLVQQFRELHTSRAQQMGWIPFFEDPDFRRFICHLLDHPQPDLSILYSTLRHGDALISYTLGFVHARTYYHWNIGFSPEYETIAPNKLHHLFLIEECFRRGYDTFDFMRGDSEYKFKWTQSYRANCRIRLLRKTSLRLMPNRILWLRERDPDSRIARMITRVRSMPGMRSIVLSKLGSRT